MIRFILRAVAAAAGFWIASKLLHNTVHVAGWESLLLAGLVLGLINALVRPILVLLTLPLTLITLGLFLLVVNGLTVWLVTVFIHGVKIHGLWAAVLTAIIISLVSWAASGLINRADERRR